MQKKRDRTNIVANILSICKDGANITRITYKANLNFKMSNRYTKYLIQRGLIKSRSEGLVLFQTTPEGVRFLEDLRQFCDLLDPKGELMSG